MTHAIHIENGQKDNKVLSCLSFTRVLRVAPALNSQRLALLQKERTPLIKSLMVRLQHNDQPCNYILLALKTKLLQSNRYFLKLKKLHCLFFFLKKSGSLSGFKIHSFPHIFNEQMPKNLINQLFSVKKKQHIARL